MFPPYKYIITRILRNVNKIYVKYVKNNRDFHTTKLNLPTGNLDSKTSQDVLELIRRTSRKFEQSVVMITHNEHIADLAERIVRIEDGKFLGTGVGENERIRE